MALYDGEIAYWDAMFGAMLDDLSGRGLLDNALVMVTADHGDMFGEHGKWTHGNCVYEDVLRIPLLIRYPGVVPGSRLWMPRCRAWILCRPFWIGWDSIRRLTWTG